MDCAIDLGQASAPLDRKCASLRHGRIGFTYGSGIHQVERRLLQFLCEKSVSFCVSGQ